jgi:hypothetical protein
MSLGPELHSESSLKKKAAKFRLNNRRMELSMITSEKRRHLIDQFVEIGPNAQSPLVTRHEVIEVLADAKTLECAFERRPDLSAVVEACGNRSLYADIGSSNFDSLVQQFFEDFNTGLAQPMDARREEIICFVFYVVGQMVSYGVAAASLTSAEFCRIASSLVEHSTNLKLIGNFFFLLTAYVEHSNRTPLNQVMPAIEAQMKGTLFEDIQTKVDQLVPNDHLLEHFIWEDMLQFYTCYMAKPNKAISRSIVS